MTSRLEKKVLTCLENKEYYEAHQVYRTLYSRWLASKKYDEVMNLLFDGANRLFSVGEIQSAFDLVDLFATALIQSNVSPSPALYDRIDQLLELLIANSSDGEEKKTAAVDARNKFVTDCVAWSCNQATRNREKKRGLSELHYNVARVYWKKELYEQARSHMLVAEKPEEFAKFLVEMHSNLGHPSEDDLFIVLAVLQLLCLHRVKTAQSLLTRYGMEHPAIHTATTPFPRPLMNFCSFLIQLIPRKNVAQFSSLVEQYQNHLSRDPTYSSYLMRIGELFFGKRAPNNGGGLLGSLFKGLLGPDKKEEPEAFSDSDMDEVDLIPMDIDPSCNQVVDDDGFETADEEEPPAPSAPKRQVVDTMDDLD